MGNVTKFIRKNHAWDLKGSIHDHSIDSFIGGVRKRLKLFTPFTHQSWMRFNTLLLEINDAHWQREENLHYPKLTWIFQKLGLHTSKLMQNFWKQCVPNFILHKFAAMQTSQHTYLKEKTEININGNFIKKDWRT